MALETRRCFSMTLLLYLLFDALTYSLLTLLDALPMHPADKSKPIKNSDTPVWRLTNFQADLDLLSCQRCALVKFWSYLYNNFLMDLTQWLVVLSTKVLIIICLVLWKARKSRLSWTYKTVVIEIVSALRYPDYCSISRYKILSCGIQMAFASNW